MAEYLTTIRKYNEATSDYDTLYPNTLQENIKGLDDLGGARIVVTIKDGSASQVVNLSGAKTVTATTNASGVATFDNLQYGEYLVTTNLSGKTKTQNVIIDTLKIYKVSFSVAEPILDDNTWAVISEISASGKAANYWNIGDTKTITINGTVGDTTFSNLSIDAYILGINHNASVEGNNRIHFCIGKVNNKTVGLVDEVYNGVTSSPGFFTMNHSYTNVGGWKDCYVRSTIMSYFNYRLPKDLISVLKTVTKYTDNTGGGSTGSSNVTATTDTYCLEAEFEVFGTRHYANGSEQNKQKQYDYYKNGNSRVRYKYNDTNTAVYWWNRSPCENSSNAFCDVKNNGLGDNRRSDYSNAIAPIFFV